MIRLIQFQPRETGNLAQVESCTTQAIQNGSQQSILLPQRMRIRLEVQNVEQAETTIGKWKHARFCYIIDHEPIVTDKSRAAIRAGRTTMEELILDQRLREPDNSWYIDDYGFYLYARPIISLMGEDISEDRTQTGVLQSLTEITKHATAN